MRRLLRQLRQFLLQQQAGQDHDHRQHHHKQEEKGQVDNGRDGGRGHHLADLLQLAQLGDKAAGGARNGAVAQPQGVAEHAV